jgi:hypothetical protein
MAVYAVIANDLYDHRWYEELVERMLTDLEAYLARWAAFADFLGEPAS